MNTLSLTDEKKREFPCKETRFESFQASLLICAEQRNTSLPKRLNVTSAFGVAAVKKCVTFIWFQIFIEHKGEICLPTFYNCTSRLQFGLFRVTSPPTGILWDLQPSHFFRFFSSAHHTNRKHLMTGYKCACSNGEWESHLYAYFIGWMGSCVFSLCWSHKICGFVWGEEQRRTLTLKNSQSSHSSLPLCTSENLMEMFPLKRLPAALSVFVAAGVNRDLCKCPVRAAHNSPITKSKVTVNNIQCSDGPLCFCCIVKNKYSHSHQFIMSNVRHAWGQNPQFPHSVNDF